MALSERAVQRALSSHASQTGVFKRVIRFDPKSAPGGGLTCALLLRTMDPTPATGLNVSACLLVWTMRIMLPIRNEPIDEVDPVLMGAARKLMARLLGDLTLAGLVRTIDPRGQAGVRMSCPFGYVEIDGTMHRIADLNVPMIVNDVWAEVQ